ncbi:Bud site selection protein RAX1 [Lachancea thermotolerans]
MSPASADLHAQRLPTLYEVLNRQTSAPVDLWSFYTFLSQYPYAINFLDFWIDAMAHLRLCKDYVKGVRESFVEWEDSQERSGANRDSRDSHDNRDSLSSSLLLEALMNDGFLDYEDSKRVSRFLQGQTDSPRLTKLLDNWQKQTEHDSGAPFKSPLTGLVDEFLKTQAQDFQKARITSKELLNNARNIVHTYLLAPEESSRYLINLPDHMRQNAVHMVLEEKRHDPDVFEQLKAISFQFLEMDCFPKFLSCVALHNLHDDITSSSLSDPLAILGSSAPGRRRSLFARYTTLSRVVLGMIFLWMGLWLGYTLVFLNYSRGIRVTTIVPFFLGFYFIWCGIYKIDILYALCGVTQTLVSNELVSSKDLEIGLNRNAVHNKTRQSTSPVFRVFGGSSRLVSIQQPFVNSMLRRRALWCLVLVLAGTAIFTVIFSCVPGHRL